VSPNPDNPEDPMGDLIGAAFFAIAIVSAAILGVVFGAMHP